MRRSSAHVPWFAKRHAHGAAKFAMLSGADEGVAVRHYDSHGVAAADVADGMLYALRAGACVCP